jgi:hypothetical protein
MSENIPGLHDFLALAHWPATERLRELMNRVKIAELSVQEVLGLVAIFEAADQRKGTHSAPVLRLTQTAQPNGAETDSPDNAFR